MAYRLLLTLLPGAILLLPQGVLVAQAPNELPPPPNNFNRAQDLRRIGNTWVKPAGRYKWPDLFRLELRDQELRFTLVPDAVRGPLRSGRKIAIEVDGSEAVWEVSTEGRTWLDAGRTIPSNHFTATAAFDRGASADRWHVKLIRSTPQNLMLLASATIAQQQLEMQFTCHPRQRVHLQVFRLEQGQRRVAANVSAADLPALLAAHPSEVREFLVPSLAQVCGGNPLRPRAADVYAVFPHIEPDSDMVRQLESILPQLESPDPRQRSAASRALHAMGRPAVLAVMRMDRSDLSFEQQTRLEHFLSQHRMEGVDPTQARADVPFLIECLSDADAAVRAAAKEALEELLGQEIPLDDGSTQEQRAARLMSAYRAMQADIATR